MARPQFQLIGHVVHVDTATIGPIVRTALYRATRLVTLAIVIPAAFLAFALIRFSLNLVSGLAGVSSAKKHPSAVRDHLNDVLAQVAAKKLLSAGQTAVTSARVRDSAGDIYPVRIEGRFLSGHITYGDSVLLRLRVVDGINVVTDGENYTSREPIRLLA